MPSTVYSTVLDDILPWSCRIWYNRLRDRRRHIKVRNSGRNLRNARECRRNEDVVPLNVIISPSIKGRNSFLMRPWPSNHQVTQVQRDTVLAAVIRTVRGPVLSTFVWQLKIGQAVPTRLRSEAPPDLLSSLLVMKIKISVARTDFKWSRRV